MFFMFIICHFSSILYLFMMEKYVWKGIYWNLYVLHQIILLSADLWCDIVKMERVLNPYLKFLGQPVYHLVRHFVSVLSPNILSCLYAPCLLVISKKIIVVDISFKICDFWQGAYRQERILGLKTETKCHTRWYKIR